MQVSPFYQQKHDTKSEIGMNKWILYGGRLASNYSTMVVVAGGCVLFSNAIDIWAALYYMPCKKKLVQLSELELVLTS